MLFLFTLLRLHDCLCAENNTHCVVIHDIRFWVREIKGPSIGSQCQPNMTFFKCDVKIDSVLNITCTRTLIPPKMCPDCHQLCFTNMAPCDVNAVIEVKSGYTVEINDDNMKHCVNPCPNSNELSSTQTDMKTSTVITIAVVSSVVFIAIISVIITVFFRSKRTRQVKKTTIDTINSDTSKYLKIKV